MGPRGRNGFSLAEVLVALAVLAIGILGVLSAFTFGMGAVRTGARTSESLNLARRVLEYVRINAESIGGTGLFPGPPPVGLDDGGSDRRALDDPPLDPAGLPAGANYTRNVQVTYPTPRVAQIRVRIFWSERGHEKVVELVGCQGQGN